jgi:hypothetical protein
VRHRVELRGIAVAVGVARRQLLAGEPIGLGQDVPGRLHVYVGIRRLAERLVNAEDLEEVELEVPHVALVVAHRRVAPRSPGMVTHR